MKNKDKKRPVLSFQADKELVYKIDSLCAIEKDSRNRVLGKILENALRNPEIDHSGPQNSLIENKKREPGSALEGEDGEKKESGWLLPVIILIATVVFGPKIIAAVERADGSTTGTGAMAF